MIVGMRLYGSIIISFILYFGVSQGIRADSPSPVATCSFPSVNHIVFGVYDTQDTNHNDSIGSITYQCSGPIEKLSIQFNKGQSDSFNRFMLNDEGHRLHYNLYLDAARQQLWGDGSSGSLTYGSSSLEDNRPTIISVYGRIPAQQTVGVGIYTDNLVITLDFN
jgi:spore coat protein U-like protein